VISPIPQKAPKPKTAREIAFMSEAAKVVNEALWAGRAMARPGVRTVEIDQAVEALYSRYGAVPVFKGYPRPHAPFPAATCLSVDEQVLHGIPAPRLPREGDLLKINTACKLNGWCAMAATTVPIGTVRPEKLRLVQVAEEMLEIAQVELPRRNWWSEVAERMQRHAEDAGYSVVEEYGGHGIGRMLHETPFVPNFVSRDERRAGQQDFRLVPGLVLSITPLVNMGKSAVKISSQWTVVTADGMPSVHVQRTLVLTPNGVHVVTDAACAACNGRGRMLLLFKCRSCNGSGWRKQPSLQGSDFPQAADPGRSLFI
jgi:methionyl aminopeptidase